MRAPLPVLISVPHGGDQIPKELHSIVALTPRDIFEDGDTLTREIYAFQDQVVAFLDTPIARACIDLNRAPTDRPPANPDGVVKTMTTSQRPVYKSGHFPDDLAIQLLLNRYYWPYHHQLDHLQQIPGLKVALDCHSMLAAAPAFSRVPGEPRPLFCLSNRGDQQGQPVPGRGPITCPPTWLQRLADCFCQVFAAEKQEVRLNDPFSGGYIIQSHFNGIVPWIQIELNRKLYLTPPYFDAQTLTVAPERIRELREKIFEVLKAFCAGI